MGRGAGNSDWSIIVVDIVSPHVCRFLRSLYTLTSTPEKFHLYLITGKVRLGNWAGVRRKMSKFQLHDFFPIIILTVEATFKFFLVSTTPCLNVGRVKSRISSFNFFPQIFKNFPFFSPSYPTSWGNWTTPP